ADSAKALGAAGSDTRPNRQSLDDEHDSLDVAIPARGPPARAFDIRLIDVRQRVRGQDAVALEERARLLGGGVHIDLDLWQERGRGHRSSSGSTTPSGPSGPPPVELVSEVYL